MVGGLFSWIVAPLLIASWMTRDLFAVLSETPMSTKLWCFFFGLLWGFGGLTFGLTMRYLGMSLGMALALGYCAVFGTLAPPLFAGQFGERILKTRSGQVIIAGVVVCLVGIAFAGMAGMSKERELSPEQSKAAIPEFNLRKGILVATFCGVMSACFSFGLAAGGPIRSLSLRPRHARALAGPAGARYGAARRLHDKCDLVPDIELSKSQPAAVLSREPSWYRRQVNGQP